MGYRRSIVKTINDAEKSYGGYSRYLGSVLLLGSVVGFEQDLISRINALITTMPNLTDREREVIRARYGLNGERVKTLEGIANEIGISVERVRNIEARILRKMRYPMKRIIKNYGEKNDCH